MRAATKAVKSARTHSEEQLNRFIDKFERSHQTLIRAARSADDSGKGVIA